MKVSITYPPLENIKGIPLLSQNRQFQWFNDPTFIYPMVPASAASLLKSRGYEVIWDDAIAGQKSYSDWENNIVKIRPDILAMETKTPVVKRHYDIVNKIKSALPETKIVLMGDHVTAFPEEAFRESSVDFVITGGDYDFLLLSLTDYINKKPGNFEPGIYWRNKDGTIQNSGKFEREV